MAPPSLTKVTQWCPLKKLSHKTRVKYYPHQCWILMGGNTLVTKSMFEVSSTDCTGGSRGQTSVEKQLFYTLKKAT